MSNHVPALASVSDTELELIVRLLEQHIEATKSTRNEIADDQSTITNINDLLDAAGRLEMDEANARALLQRIGIT